MNKKQAILAVVIVLTFLLGGVAGRVYQNFKNGYHHEILRTESFPFPDGEVTLSYAFESVGMPFMETETSVLTVAGRYGLPITVYKAKRGFQESSPYVRNVSTEANRIRWSDGINEYQLTVEPDHKEAKPQP